MYGNRYAKAKNKYMRHYNPKKRTISIPINYAHGLWIIYYRMKDSAEWKTFTNCLLEA